MSFLAMTWIFGICSLGAGILSLDCASESYPAEPDFQFLGLKNLEQRFLVWTAEKNLLLGLEFYLPLSPIVATGFLFTHFEH